MPSITSVKSHVGEASLRKRAFDHDAKLNDKVTMSLMPGQTQSSIASRYAKYGNPALQIDPQHRAMMVESDVPEPLPTQLLIHVRCTGICGSDVHLWRSGAIGPLTVREPCILGHEAAGVVVGIGAAVRNFAVGDRVAIEPGVPCESCHFCTSGRYNLCEAVAFAGVCPHPGTIRRFTTHEARYCHKLPNALTFAQGALVEPLSVALHAVASCHGSVAVGRPALVCGAGPIGVITLAVARASGAWPLVITDVAEKRLDFARKLVPGVQTYRIDASKSPLENACRIKDLYGCGASAGNGFIHSVEETLAPSTVLECTGVESSIITAAYACQRGGTVMVVGVGKSIMNNLPFMHMSLAEVSTTRITDWQGDRPLTLPR